MMGNKIMGNKLAGFCMGILFVAGLIAGAWAQTNQPLPSSEGSAERVVVQSNLADELSKGFYRALQDFLGQDRRAAASEIRKGAALIKREALSAQGKTRRMLKASVEELQSLARKVENGTAVSVKELEEAFARAHETLATYYHQKASGSWAAHTTSKAGRELKAAANHVEDALAWTVHHLEASAKAAIQDARSVGDELISGTGWVGSRVEQAIEAIGNEVEKLGRSISPAESQRPISDPKEVQSGAGVELSTAIVQVAKENIPAVVHVEVTQRQEVANPMLPFQNDPFFRYFFDIPRMPKKFKRELKGLGTGIIIDPRGHILTNNHVVGGATEIQVLLSDERQYPAKVVGVDPKTDLAVIEISAKEPLPHVTFGDSDKVEVGEWVVAVGHPRGFDQTVTQGIISAKHRHGITDPSGYQDFLQTDAAINPGNSGGPLLNLHGEVIGVNAAIVSQSGGFEGIGFAIPSNMALHVAQALISHGRVERGWLGVSVQELTPEMAKSFGLETPKGALIADVIKDGPADRTGVQRGDVIVAYRGREITDASTLRNEVANTPIDQEVELSLVRNGHKHELRVKTGSLEEQVKVLASTVRQRLGAEFRPVSAKERAKYNLNPEQGVAIAWLEHNGPLGNTGLEVADIILEVNGQPAEGLGGFLNLVDAVKPDQRIVLLGLDHRTGQTGYVQVTVR